MVPIGLSDVERVVRMGEGHDHGERPVPAKAGEVEQFARCGENRLLVKVDLVAACAGAGVNNGIRRMIPVGPVVRPGPVGGPGEIGGVEPEMRVR